MRVPHPPPGVAPMHRDITTRLDSARAPSCPESSGCWRRTSAASAATAPSAVQATADTAPAPLVIPGYRLTPGIGSAPEPGPVASVGPPPGIPDREPRLLSQLKIAYPDRASRDGLEGTVRLRISVDAQGRVTSAKVLSGPGIELNEAALAAILTARFEPATKEGEPVATSMIYLYVFTLE